MSTACEQVTAPVGSSPARGLTFGAAGSSPPAPRGVQPSVLVVGCCTIVEHCRSSGLLSAGPRCFCWASASGGKGGLGLALGACELTAGERTPGMVGVSEHHGGWWEAARGATHQVLLPLHLSSSFPAEMSPVPEQGSACQLPDWSGGTVTRCLLPALLGSWFVSLLGRCELCLWHEDASF